MTNTTKRNFQKVNSGRKSKIPDKKLYPQNASIYGNPTRNIVIKNARMI